MKPRPDNVLANLPEQPHKWIDEGHSQAKIVSLLAEQFGVQTHNTSIGRYCQKLATEERNFDASLSTESLKTAEPEEFDQAGVDGLKYKLYKLATSPNANTVEFARLFRLRLRMKDQDLARKKFEYNVAKAIMENFNKVAKIMRQKDQHTDRAALNGVRLECFGVLTDQEEPITYDKPADASASDEKQNLIKVGTSVSLIVAPSLDQSPSGNLCKSVDQPSASFRIHDSPSLTSCALVAVQPSHSPETSEYAIGDAIIMKPESARHSAQSFSDSYFDTPMEETPFTPDDKRNYKVNNGTDYFGPYFQWEYCDGHNPHGADTKYFCHQISGTFCRRREQ